MRLPLPAFVAAAFFSLALAGCGSASRTYSYTPPPTPGGRLCSNQCQEARGYCQQTCDLRDRSCVDDAQAAALRDYDRYVQKQFADHQPFDLLPRDFENDTPCTSNKKSCYNKCEDQYSVCFQNCGGKVSLTSSCLFLCF